MTKFFEMWEFFSDSKDLSLNQHHFFAPGLIILQSETLVYKKKMNYITNVKIWHE